MVIIKHIFKRLFWFIRSDIKLKTTTVWDLDGEERIDGFYFLSKRPFSKAYQWHATIPLNYTYPILKLIQDSIKQKRKLAVIEISLGIGGYERVCIWKGSLKKAEKQMFEMIKELQNQY